MAVNKENVDHIINMIREDNNLKFSMSYYFTENGGVEDGWCGTAACIAGYCSVAKIGIKEALNREGDAYEIGLGFLGITDHQANTLFLPPVSILDGITKDEAITVLENLRDTGKVQWSVAGYDDIYDQDEEDWED